MPCSAPPCNQALPAASRSQRGRAMKGESPSQHSQQATPNTVLNSVQTEQNPGQCDNGKHPLPGRSPQEHIERVGIPFPDPQP
jgi:hypothetical protein